MTEVERLQEELIAHNNEIETFRAAHCIPLEQKIANLLCPYTIGQLLAHKDARSRCVVESVHYDSKKLSYKVKVTKFKLRGKKGELHKKSQWLSDEADWFSPELIENQLDGLISYLRYLSEREDAIFLDKGVVATINSHFYMEYLEKIQVLVPFYQYPDHIDGFGWDGQSYPIECIIHYDEIADEVSFVEEDEEERKVFCSWCATYLEDNYLK